MTSSLLNSAIVDTLARGNVATPRQVLIADLFCGAGGFSTGAVRALRRMGIEPLLTAVNHWPVAIQTHSLGHPTARHYIEDLAKAEPLELVPEGYLDLLLSSPSCTHHSRARSGRITSDQERSDPYHILKWVTELRTKRLILENVEEFKNWGPVSPRTGRPIKSRNGEYFRAWVQALKDLGFTNIAFRVLNAADFGDGTSRRRFFLIARSDGVPISWPEPSHGEPDLLNPHRKPHRGAREFIDWTDAGRSIFDRKRPLAPNTHRRIGTGLSKFSGDASLPYLHVMRAEGLLPEGYTIPAPRDPRSLRSIHYRNRQGEVVHLYGDEVPPLDSEAVAAPEPIVFQVNQGSDRFGTQRPVSEPLFTVVTRDSLGLATPTTGSFVCANRNNNVAKGLDEPIPVVTTAHGGGLFLATPEVKPFTLGQQSNAAPRSVEDPIATVATAGKISLTEAVVEPFVLGQHGGAEPRSVDDPVPTITTDGYVRIFRPTAEPFVLNRHGDNGTGNRAHALSAPIPTATCSGAGYLVEPYLVNLKSGSAPVGMKEPVPTLTAHASHLALAQPCLVVVNHGDGAGGNHERRVKPVDQPLPTVTTNRSFGLAQTELFALERPVLHPARAGAAPTTEVHLDTPACAQPFVTPYYGSNVGSAAGADGIDEPLATITARANKHGLCRAFVTPYYGVSIPQSVEEPLGTVTTRDRFALVEPFLVPQFGERAGQEPRTHRVRDPLPAVTSHGAGALVQADAEPLLVQVDQTGSNGGCVRSVTQPLPTVVTKQNTAVVEPFIVSTRHVTGGPSPRTVESPLPTLTAGGSQVAVVEPRMAGEANARRRSGRLVWINGVPQWLDVLFRMLRNHELAGAMGFDNQVFCGTSTEQTRQIGNAVPVNTATALVTSVMADLPAALGAAPEQLADAA